MDSFKQRVHDERIELESKINKLTTFVNSEVHQALNAAEKIRLRAQLAVMREYHDILIERIKFF